MKFLRVEENSLSLSLSSSDIEDFLFHPRQLYSILFAEFLKFNREWMVHVAI